jgi:hypothetical protein
VSNPFKDLSDDELVREASRWGIRRGRRPGGSASGAHSAAVPRPHAAPRCCHRPPEGTAKSSRTLVRLTWALVVLTVVLVVPTILLAVDAMTPSPEARAGALVLVLALDV